MLEVGVGIIFGLVALFILSPLIIGLIFFIETVADLFKRY